MNANVRLIGNKSLARPITFFYFPIPLYLYAYRNIYTCYIYEMITCSCLLKNPQHLFKKRLYFQCCLLF